MQKILPVEGFESLPLWCQVLVCALVFCFLLECGTRGIRFGKTWLRRTTPHDELRDASGALASVTYPEVSIILCVRSCKEFLHILPHYFSQSYPSFFDIIVVDDSGDDEVGASLERYRQTQDDKRMYITRMGNVLGGVLPPKKLSYSLGFKASTHDWVVLGSLTSYPRSQYWLRSLMESRREKDIVVLGPSICIADLGRSHSFFSLIERAHSMMNSASRLSYAYVSKIALGYEGNLAFQRSLYFTDRGMHAGLSHLLGGEDTLLSFRLSRLGSVGVACTADSVVLQQSDSNWFSWWRNYFSRISPKHYFPPWVRFRIALDRWIHFLFLIFALCLVIGYGKYKIALYLGVGLPLLRFLLFHMSVLRLRSTLQLATVWKQTWSWNLLQDVLYDLLLPCMASVNRLFHRQQISRI